MFQNLFRCPHCEQDNIQVVLGDCLIEDEAGPILAFRCANCHWEHQIGDERSAPSIFSRGPLSGQLAFSFLALN